MADPVLEQWEAARLIDRHHAYGHREQKIADAGDALAEALRAEREAHQSQQREAIRQMDRGNKAKAKLATERSSNADLSEALDEAIRERDAWEATADRQQREKIAERQRAAKAEAENERLRAALRWYAAEGAWARTPTGGGHYNPAPASLDGGERAREALTAIEKEAGC